ncbi:hypothetical protein Tco_0904387, partial [Tanacetum coccineum]
GGCSDSGISSLRSIGGGMYRDGGSAAVTASMRAWVDVILSGAMHLARRSPAEGADSEIGGDGDGVVMQKT